MERKIFFKSLGVLFTGGLLACNINEVCFNKISFTSELELNLKNYFGKNFNSDSFDFNMLPSKGQLMLIDSFEIQINNEKNDIFEISNVVIDKVKTMQFDATALLYGKIPNGLNVFLGGVKFEVNENLVAFKIEELKNYDAQIIFKNPILIKYDVPFEKWSTEKMFNSVLSNRKTKIFKGEISGIKIYKMYNDIVRNIAVAQINPLLFIEGTFSDQVVLTKGTYALNVTEEHKKIILL